MSPASCMSLPLNSIWYPSLPSYLAPQGFGSMTVDQVYAYDPLSSSVTPISLPPLSKGCRLAKRFLKDVDISNICLHPFFARLLLPDNPLGNLSPLPLQAALFTSPFIQRFSSQSFRAHSIAALHIPSSNYPTLTPAKWKLFWSLPLSHVAR
ncbi:hypothetical protein CLU79DRAFT_778239, partial [Phycomyces nitens]